MDANPGPNRLPAGRHALPRDVVLASQRERIIEAMTDACADDGYGAVNIAQVVQRARVSRTVFYELFGDKEGCFLAAFDAFLAPFATAMARAAGDEDAWPDQMRAGLGAGLAHLATHPSQARLGVVDVFAAGPTALDRYREAIRSIVPAIDAGRACRPLPGPPERTATALIDGLALVVRDELLSGRAAELPAACPELLFTILGPYLGHERAAAYISAHSAG